ncbi:hypothetical protein FM996_07475 [Methylosinus sporium]|uniref:Zinc finger FPG/IleRS-type domain-containing protein n=1 Tax=Methylosinus sporium TaxID=428 RepID=A0A549T0S2_METSR|nr:zinc finger domain-containing protein [Methylosinus sporium]MBU3886823.1 hypothetical protein [Methylosinus sp. KRF6]TRL35460.1 hypothetical protein FM996_07475 [Methylosinus sporium]
MAPAGQGPTPGCRGHVSRVIQSGRSTFFCRDCQK